MHMLGVNVANPVFVYAFILIAVLLLLYLIMIKWKNKNFDKFGDRSVINNLFPDYSPKRQNLKFVLVLLAAVLVIIAMIDPRVGSKLGTAKHKGADIIIALDVSKSMLSEDVKPNRLIRAKQSLAKYTEKLEGYKVGVVVFAGKAYPKLPLTPDMAAVKNMLETSEVDQIPAQGTAVGEAIFRSISSLASSKSKDKAIIIVSDGENHEDDAIEAAKLASENNIRIFSLGVGTPQGAPIPVYQNGVRQDFKRDKSGNTIITKLQEELLERVAIEADGMYVRANNINEGLNEVFKEIRKMEGDEYEAAWFVEYEDRYQYFLAFAVFLLLVESIISSKKGIIEKLNIFSEPSAFVKSKKIIKNARD